MGVSKYDRAEISERFVRHYLERRRKSYPENIFLAILHLVSNSSKNPSQPITVLHNLNP